MDYLKFKNNKGFTLVQLIVTVSVIIILAGSVLFNEGALARKGKAQDVQRQYDIAAIGKAIELYQIDNDALPADLSSANINTGDKVVLCSSAASLTCDGQTKNCLVVDDADFLGVYMDSLPLDPTKTTDTDTGYYITRTGDMMTFGVCDTYNNEDISYVAKAALGAYVITCGDGVTEGAEVCDDGNLFVEGCGNATIETAGDYCNADCSAVITISSNEACDSDLTTSCYDSPSGKTYYAGSYVSGEEACDTESICTGVCSLCASACIAAPEFCGDGSCNNGESPMSCPQDCNAMPS